MFLKNTSFLSISEYFFYINHINFNIILYTKSHLLATNYSTELSFNLNKVL